MSKNFEPALPEIPDYLQTTGPVTLSSIRKSRGATMRGKSGLDVRHKDIASEMEVYLNQTVFDMSLRLDAIERYVQSDNARKVEQPEIMNHIAEVLKELKLCADIGNFAIKGIRGQ
jgi:hypothetical protein